MELGEDFLHHWWQFRWYGRTALKTEDGELVEVIHPGRKNPYDGPDFSHARIKIGGTEWVGQVELHCRSSEWYQHGHHEDDRYGNVILHVVYIFNRQVSRWDGSAIPTLCLQPYISRSWLERYKTFLFSSADFPCQQQIGRVAPERVLLWLEKLLVIRLEEKTKAISFLIERGNGDWEAAFYQLVAKCFGFSANAFPMEMLARSLPYRLIYKYSDQRWRVEALLFGQAGFLTAPYSSAYALQLSKEYRFLRKKHRLEPIDVATWRFKQLRPANFPTLRLAQFAHWVCLPAYRFSNLIDRKKNPDFSNKLPEITVSPFWERHFHFHRESRPGIGRMGQQAMESLLINGVIPCLFAYGRSVANAALQDMAFSWLEKLNAEDNRSVRSFIKAGIQVKTAGQSQAILQLKKDYCCQNKCLNCAIGHYLLKPGHATTNRHFH